MEKYIEVKNFGKIEHAKIAYNGYTVFMGDNNSGKTYLMQLIYAVEKKLNGFNYKGKFVELLEDKMSTSEPFQLHKDDMKLMIDDINIFLENEKDKIIIDNFRKNINIDNLSIQTNIDELSVKVQNMDNYKTLFKQYEAKKYVEIESYITIDIMIGSERISYITMSGKVDAISLAQVIISDIFGVHNPLYLPASRAGIQLLYKDYFTARADSQFYVSNEKTVDIKLTGPMYEYLRFLQRVERNNNLLKFCYLIKMYDN